MVRYGMVWYGMVWYGMVWYGMVWCDMVWYGMVWYGMVWYWYQCAQESQHILGFILFACVVQLQIQSTWESTRRAFKFSELPLQDFDDGIGPLLHGISDGIHR
jgi:hypothetical protein